MSVPENHFKRLLESLVMVQEALEISCSACAAGSTGDELVANALI